jgi:predicted heme/steroid binding protein
MQGQGFSLDSIRKMAEDKIMVAVDGVVSHIPNGQQYRDQFHQAINNALNELQQQAQSQMGNLSGMMGNITGRQPNQPTPPTH